MENISDMKKILMYFTYKYNGNWEKIYNAIKTKEFVHPLSLDKIIKSSNKNYIAIIDSDYPHNFKKIYMPPMSLFYVGDRKILNWENIISIWGNFDLNDILKLDINKKNALAITLQNNKENIINLSKNGYSLIIIDENNNGKEDKIDFLNQLNSFCYISEFPQEITNYSKSEEQTIERLLLGVSNYSIMINPSIKDHTIFKNIHEIEQRKQHYYRVENPSIRKDIELKIIKNFSSVVNNNN